MKRTVAAVCAAVWGIAIACALPAAPLLLPAAELSEPKWQTVLAGSVIAPPLCTSYGFAALIEGRQLAAVSENGTVFWQKGIRGKPDPYIAVSRDDFLYTVSSGNRVTVYNPSGLVVHYIDCDEPVVLPPKPGRDGRVFIAGQSSISCYGTDGKRRWHIAADAGNGMPLYELNDGTLLYMQKKAVNGGSTALRFSPFGELLEEVVFTGIASCATECPDGVIVGFTDGTVGCCTAGADGSVFTAWTTAAPQAGTVPEYAVSDGALLFVLYIDIARNAPLAKTSDTPAFSAKKADTATQSAGTVSGKDTCILSGSSISVQHGCRPHFAAELPFPSGSVSGIYQNGDSCTVIAAAGAVSYAADGNPDWHYRFASGGNRSGEKAAGFAVFSPAGYLLKTDRNWTVSAYRLAQKTGTKNAPANRNKSRRYEAAPGRTSLLDDDALYQAVTAGNYGSAEHRIRRTLDDTFSSLFAFYQEQNSRYSGAGSARTARLPEWSTAVFLAGKFGCSAYTDVIADILTTEKDSSLLIATVRAAEALAFDPESALLSALYRLACNPPGRDPRVYTAVCDAVLSICRYMGKPALFTQGKLILRQLSQPQYGAGIREYVIKTYKEIAAFEISS